MLKGGGKDKLPRIRKRKKNKVKIKWRMAVIAAAAAVFIISFIYYFMNTYIETEREYAIYSSMEEPTLPLITAEVNGTEINVMYGYLQEMGSMASSGSITPLSEDRKLKLNLKMYGTKAAGMSYEIRSLDTEHFIEKTQIIDSNEKENGDVEVILNIQNLIKKNVPYLLKFQIELGEETVNYYTRIIWPENDDIYRFIDTAREFTEKSFNKEEARDLTVYLETDPGLENKSLANINLKSGFAQITWGNTDMELISGPLITVKEYDGIMGAVQVSYKTRSEDISGNYDEYMNTDNYTLKSGQERIYIMDLERNTDQIFNGNKHFFLGKRINLGITNESSIQTEKSENKRYLVYKSGKELWLYDQEGKKAVNIFSYRSENDTVRSDHCEHDIKIMSVSDDGEVDFTVIGYVNRGKHEGYNGIIYYRYEINTGTLSEVFFIPVNNTYEKIKTEADEMLKKNASGMVYIKQNETITAIDLTSLEMLDVVSGLTNGKYAISNDQTQIAWIEGEVYTPNTIKLMDIVTGNTQVIGSGAGEILSVIDFYNNDLIYGTSRINDLIRTSGRITGIMLRNVKIIEPGLEQVLDYSRDGLYLGDVIIDKDRIHIGQYRLNEETGRYRFAGRDTIVCSEEQRTQYLNDVFTDINEIKGEIYYIELEENIKTTRSLDIGRPENLSYENAGTIDMSAVKPGSIIRYYAYSGCALKGMCYSLKEAMELIYDDMGWIVDENSAMIYSRVDRSARKVISEPLSEADPLIEAVNNDYKGDILSEDGWIIIDAYGIQLNKLLYFVDKGKPIMAMTEDGSYCLIYGYTADSVYIYYTSDEENINSNAAMTLDDASMYFDKLQNDFIVCRSYQGNK